ncbi:MAG: hypothetical protein WCE48_00995 [Steroidobacteraceae bacterium]
MNNTQVAESRELRAGEWVEIRSKEEILATLDGNGRIEQMPFMPEMLKFCGQRVRVSKRAHKTCDPVNGLQSRRLPRAVHLEDLRCDGAAHAGCQAGCLLFWKEAWVKRVDSRDAPSPSNASKAAEHTPACTEQGLMRATLAAATPANDGAPIYVCQATQVAAATTPLPWWDLRQYVDDYRSGNATLSQMASAWIFWAYHTLTGAGIGLGSAMRWAYDNFQKLIGGSPYPWRMGRIPHGGRTPARRIDVQEGEFVRVKPYREILETLDDEWKNRGLYFDAEMVPYTSGTFKVLKRVTRIIDEKTGKMLNFKNECLILDGVVCQARYAKCRKLCPRRYYLYWREIWVDKVSGGAPR